MKEKVLGIINTVRNTDYFVKLIVFSVVCVCTVVLSLIFSGVKIGYTVSYGEAGSFTVSEKADFDKAVELALGSVDTEDKKTTIYSPKFSLALILPARENSGEEIAQGILKNTAELKKSAVLNVDGKNIAYAASAEELQAVIDERLNSYNIADAENSAEFIEKVSINEVYCRKSDYTDLSVSKNAVANLSVKTTAKYKTEVIVGYSTVTEKTSSKLVGYRAIKQNGENGINHNVEEVVMVNGQEVSRQTLEQDVVKAPVNCVILVGTASANANISSRLLFPLPRNSRYFITTAFGAIDGTHAHVHKGIDYAAPKGTSIFAAESGTVVTSGTHREYGKYIVINHGNGLRTLYAHCSALYVRVGEEVNRGQVIAAVGSTGRSTGNHLHFEVITNGSYVNPEKYTG